MKFPPFHIPEVWKRYPVRTEPPRFGLNREPPWWFARIGCLNAPVVVLVSNMNRNKQSIPPIWEFITSTSSVKKVRENILYGQQQLHVHFSLKCLSLSLFIGDTSASTSDDQSPLLWISVAVAGVLLFVMVLLILVIYKKNRNASFRVEKEVKWRKELHIDIDMHNKTQYIILLTSLNSVIAIYFVNTIYQ